LYLRGHWEGSTYMHNTVVELENQYVHL
jgi:hypothetical protein